MSARRKLFFASCTSFFAPGASTREGFAPDDVLALEPLRDQGFDVEAKAWNAPHVLWEEANAVIVRSTWDYLEHPTEFRAWIDRLRALGVRVWNPALALLWNFDKSYLETLARQGIPVVPTQTFRRKTGASAGDLAALLDRWGWKEAVVKPVVSAGAANTWRVKREALDSPAGDGAAEEFPKLAAAGDLLVQPYLPEVARDGEWSFVFFNRRFSHALLKKPKEGDFRVQTKYGGGVTPVPNPPERYIRWAERALEPVEVNLLYARVDFVVVHGEPLLMELELLEPELFLRTDPGAPLRFARAVSDAMLGAGA